MVTVQSFSQLEFSPDVGIAGFEMASVYAGEALTAKLWRVPRGWNLSRVGVEENFHVHTSVFEYAAVLQGRFPHIEYDVPSQRRWKTAFRPGDLMIRPPGSVHGLDSSMAVPEETLLLYANSGPGTSILDPGYASETVDVLDGTVPRGVATDGVCRIDRPLDDPSAEDERIYSLPAEPARFAVRRLAAGEVIGLEAILGRDTLFSFLWQGACTLEESKGISRPIAEWTTLTHGARQAAVGGALLSNSGAVDACWLTVGRNN